MITARPAPCLDPAVWVDVETTYSTVTVADLSPDEARDLAATLTRAADQVETACAVAGCNHPAVNGGFCAREDH